MKKPKPTWMKNTTQLVEDNERRIGMYYKMLVIAKEHGDEYEQERITRAIAEWNEDTQYLLDGGTR